MLPFQRIPTRIIIELTYYSVFWLNTFPTAGGISDTLSPRTIIVGSTIDYAQHCRIEFGTYVQTRETHDNSMTPRTTSALALLPTNNHQGGHLFFSLSTGKILNRNHWTALPMPLEVVDRVHVLAQRSLSNHTLTFANPDGVEADEDDDDESYHPTDDNDDDNSTDDDDYNNGDETHAGNNPIHTESDEIAGVNENNVENNVVDGNDIINQNENESQTESQTENADENIAINGNDVINQNENESQTDTQTENADKSENEDENIITNQNEDHEEVDLADMVDVEVQTENEDNTTDEDNIETQMDKRYGRQTSQYNLWGSKTSRLWAFALYS